MKDVFHAQFFQTELEVSMTNLARLSQRSNEKASNFIARFKRAKHKCRVNLPETEFVNLALNGLEFRLRKKFDATEFRDLVDLTYRVTRYETLLQVEKERNNSSFKTYYRDPNMKIDAAELIRKEPYTCEALIKKEVVLKNQFRKKDAPKKYSFNVSKANEIFDQLMKERLIKLPNGVTLHSYEELKGKSYCKWHNA